MLTEYMVHLIKLPEDKLRHFTKAEAQVWIDKGLSVETVRWYLDRERDRRRT